MAIRQYIGARYVPIFGRKDEDTMIWDNTKPYEPLTVVLYQGNSYTSRQPVPIGIDISNEEFWACTGNYNAQVEQYRLEVQSYDGRITTAQNTADGAVSTNEAQDAQLAGTSPSGLKTAIDDVSESTSAAIEAQDQALQTAIEEQDTALASAISTQNENLQTALNAQDAQIDTLGDNLTALSGRVTTNEGDISALTSRMDNLKQTVLADTYGAVGDGQTDCTLAIQRAIDENPLSTVSFVGGVYCISDTIFLNGDLDSVNLDLNGATLKWTGSIDSWLEGQTFTIMAGHEGITSTPSVMIAVERRQSNYQYSAGRTIICNGYIDCNYAASIGIQNVVFTSVFENLRISNFMYAGILNGTLDGNTYVNGTISSSSGRSTQTFISDCYFTRGNDMSARANTSAIMVTFPDNQIDNCVTNRTDCGITLRIGGNSISNTHFTTQYATDVAAPNYGGCACRLWPLNAGSSQINLFDNCYFNAMKRVFYTYHDTSQSFTGANLRTICSNSHYTFYRSTSFTSVLNAEWYGGMWYGVMQTVHCAFLYGDYLNMHMYAPTAAPSVGVARASEHTVGNLIAPHEHCVMHDAANYVNGEWFPMNNSSAPIPEGYKKVAELVTSMPVGTYHIPGLISFEIGCENGLFVRKGDIYYSNGTYTSNIDVTHGSTTMKFYIRNANASYTYNGVTYYATALYVQATSSISDIRFLKLTPSSPFVSVYAFAFPTNFSDGTNKNTYTSSPTDLVEIF